MSKFSFHTLAKNEKDRFNKTSNKQHLHPRYIVTKTEQSNPQVGNNCPLHLLKNYDLTPTLLITNSSVIH